MNIRDERRDTLGCISQSTQRRRRQGERVPGERHKRGNERLPDGLLDVLKLRTQYLDATIRVARRRRAAPELLLHFAQDDGLRLGFLAVLHVGFNEVFLRLGKIDIDSLERSHVGYRVVKRFAQLDGRALGVLAHCLGHVKHGLGGLREDVLANGGRREQQIFY